MPPPLVLAGALAAAALALASSTPAAAQAPRPADAASVTARAHLLVDRVMRLHACLTDARERAIEAQVILDQARRTIDDPAADPAARRDAADTVRAVDARLRRIEAGVVACTTDPASGGFALGPAPPPEVHEVGAPVDPAVAAVGRDAPSLEVVEVDVWLVPGVRAVRGERVDGTGRLAPEHVRRAVRATAPALAGCAAERVERAGPGAPPVEATLVFTVAPDGTTRRPRVEDVSTRDARFVRCLRDAAATLQLAEGPTGGTASFAYTLRFAPD